MGVAHVHKGPAAGERMSLLAALPVHCISPAEHNNCNPVLDRGVASAVRMDLELRGFEIVDAETLNNETHPHELHADGIHDDRTREAEWSQLAADTQQALLRAVGVQGVVTTDFKLGEDPWYDSDQTVKVTVSVRTADATLVWSSACAVEGGPELHIALAKATHCALESATLW